MNSVVALRSYGDYVILLSSIMTSSSLHNYKITSLSKCKYIKQVNILKQFKLKSDTVSLSLSKRP